MQYIVTGVDNGDGSLGIEFFDSLETLQFAEEHWPEDYRSEGGTVLEGNLVGIEPTTMQDLLERYGEY